MKDSASRRTAHGLGRRDLEFPLQSMMLSDILAYNVLLGSKKRTHVCGGQGDLMTRAGVEAGGGVRDKGGAVPFKWRLKASQALTLDLKVPGRAS